MGPLKGFRIIEMAGIGPGPFAGMMFADMGAEVISVERPGVQVTDDIRTDINRRGKKSINLNMKTPEGQQALLKLCETADAIFEGYRPGVMEKLGLAPEDVWQRNPKLVYGRLTGWGQSGPLAHTAGHDINYIALTGALHAMGPADKNPTAPLNLVGDYAGGAMMLVTGMLAAMLETQKSGKGQVIDAGMVDGASLIMSLMHSLKAGGLWSESRGRNFLDGGAHFYDTYETADGKYISFGAIEPHFMMVFMEKTGFPAEHLQDHMNPKKWPALKEELKTLFKQKTQAEWCDILEGTDACFAPVVPFWEAHEHPHNIARENFIDVDGMRQPAPAPKFSRSTSEVPQGAHEKGSDTHEVLESIGYTADQIEKMQ